MAVKRCFARQLHWIAMHVVAEHRDARESYRSLCLDRIVGKRWLGDDVTQQLQRSVEPLLRNGERPAEAVAARDGRYRRAQHLRIVGDLRRAPAAGTLEHR